MNLLSKITTKIPSFLLVAVLPFLWLSADQSPQYIGVIPALTGIIVSFILLGRAVDYHLKQSNSPASQLWWTRF